MIGNKYTGDSIAAEFMKIMGPKTSPGETLEKSASTENDLVEAAESMLADTDHTQSLSDPIDSALEAVNSMLEEGSPEHVPQADEGPTLAVVDSAEAEMNVHTAFSESETYLI